MADNGRVQTQRLVGGVCVAGVNSTRSAFALEFSGVLQSGDLALGRSGEPWRSPEHFAPGLSGPGGEVTDFVENARKSYTKRQRYKRPRIPRSRGTGVRLMQVKVTYPEGSAQLALITVWTPCMRYL